MKTNILILILALIITINCQDLQIHKQLYGKSLNGTWSNNKQNSTILGIKFEQRADYDILSTQQRYNLGIQWRKQYQSYFSQSVDQKGMIGFFVKNQGYAQVLISQNNNGKPIVHIQLRSSKYIDHRILQFSFVLNKGYSKLYNQWKTPKFLTSVYLYNNLIPLSKTDLLINFQLKKINKKQIQINIISDSLNLKLNLSSINTGYDQFIIFTVINIFQIMILVYYSNKKNVQQRVQLSNTSQWFILHNCLFIITQIFFLTKIGLGYYDTTLSCLLINVITNFVVLMLNLKTFQTVLQKLKNKYKFMLTIIFSLIYFYLVFHYYHKSLFWIIQSSIMLWQISYSIFKGGDSSVSLLNIFQIIIGRVPSILMLFQQNIIKIRPSQTAAILIIAILFSHSLIVYLQKNIGGRFFTPLAIMPDYYNYLRQTIYSSTLACDQCSICTNQIRAPCNQTGQQLQKRKIDQKKIPGYNQKLVHYVCTPCNHVFHKQCLSQWLQAHLVCPMDRNTLPPMNF